MLFVFQVTVEVERESGKFAGRDEIGEQIEQELSDADPSQIEGENGSLYNTVTWEVEEVPQKK